MIEKIIDAENYQIILKSQNSDIASIRFKIRVYPEYELKDYKEQTSSELFEESWDIEQRDSGKGYEEIRIHGVDYIETMVEFYILEDKAYSETRGYRSNGGGELTIKASDKLNSTLDFDYLPYIQMNLSQLIQDRNNLIEKRYRQLIKEKIEKLQQLSTQIEG